jgi:5,10-methylenetetrahydromethanopterin reductase
VTVVDEDRSLARRAAKRALALYLPIVAKLDCTVSVDPELVGRIQKYVEQGDRMSAGRLITDDLLTKFAFAGDASDLVEQAEILFESGVSRIEFGTPHGIKPGVGIRLIGEEVLPRLIGGG